MANDKDKPVKQPYHRHVDGSLNPNHFLGKVPYSWHYTSNGREPLDLERWYNENDLDPEEAAQPAIADVIPVDDTEGWDFVDNANAHQEHGDVAVVGGVAFAIFVGGSESSM